MPSQTCLLLAAGDIPDAHRAVVPTSSDELPILTECDRVDRSMMTNESNRWLIKVATIPKFGEALFKSDSNLFSVGAKATALRP